MFLTQYQEAHLMLKTLSFICDYYFSIFFYFGNTFQNLNVSSPAPVTIDSPSGDIAKYNTRVLWPVRLAIFRIEGYFHIHTAFSLYPWVLTNSEVFLLNIKLQTWDSVWIEYISVPWIVFQNFIQRSAVPPPDTSNPFWCGDQAIAFTAA